MANTEMINAGTVIGNEEVGGIFGHLPSSCQMLSLNFGTVIGSSSVGGIIGYLFEGNVRNSYNFGEVRGDANRQMNCDMANIKKSLIAMQKNMAELVL